MAFTSGTVTGHYNLLVALKTFVSANGWTVENFVDDGGSTTDGPGSILNLQGPGNGAGETVNINIRTVNNSSLPSNGWQISGSIGYQVGAEWGGQNSEGPSPYFNLWANSINYWFFVNNRRIIVVCQISTTFVSMYAGFFLPWANPAQYPLPLYVAGDYFAACNWSYSSTGRRFCIDCGGGGTQSGGWVRDPNGNWVPVENEQTTGTYNDQGVGLNPGLFVQVWPWASGSNQGGNDGNFYWGASGSAQSFGGGMDLLIPTRQGERFIWPTQILYGAGSPLGSHDGLYATFGSGLSAGSTVCLGSRAFLAFQNISRTSGNDFMLVEEV